MARQVLDTENLAERFPYAKVKVTKRRTVADLLRHIQVNAVNAVVLTQAGVRLENEDVLEADEQVVVITLIAGG